MKKLSVFLALEDRFSFRHSACGKAARHIRSRFNDPVAAGTWREAVTSIFPPATRTISRNSHSSGSFDTCCIAEHAPEVACCDRDLWFGAKIYNGFKSSVIDLCPYLLPRNRTTTVPGRELPLAPVLKNAAAQLRQAFRGCTTGDGDPDVYPLRSLIPKCWLPFAFS